MARSQVADYSDALIAGPWRHTFVAANGSRFHAAEAGPASGPLVVLLHNFGQFWWAWRHQIPTLAEAGYRVVALDARGAAASDKPPMGYDTPTRTRDVAAVIRSLGHDRAAIIGHGTGGEIAWSMGALQPAVTVAIGALASPSPARLHATWPQLLTPIAARMLAFCQVPILPERRLRETDLLKRIFDAGAASPVSPETAELYRTVLRIPFAAHGALEGVRWAVRSIPRPDGRRYLNAVRRPLSVPVLQLQGGADGFLRRRHIDADAGAVTRNLRFQVLEDVGHYLPEEAPDAVSEALLDWLAEIRRRA